MSGAVFYAPKPAYEPNDMYTLLRNPHIARNEEVIAKPFPAGALREKYLWHLHYVVMLDSRSLIPERLGGADYDGDMIKTISDPLMNRCVARNYGDNYENEGNLPLLKIPAAEPILADAQDWKARFETVKATFSSRVGQISNAALRRSIIAYDENTTAEEKQQYRQETEVLAILTGLEIDSAKVVSNRIYLNTWEAIEAGKACSCGTRPFTRRATAGNGISQPKRNEWIHSLVL